MSEWISEIEKARFWSTCNKTNYCWEWTGGLSIHGYGSFRLKDKVVSAHRLAFSICSGIRINDLDVVAHKCDNPSCVNPSHLFHTDHEGNMRDKQLKGRSKTGKSSKYKGVSFRKDNGKWRALIRVDGKYKHLGNYATEKEAAIARDNYVKDRFQGPGLSALLNFPSPPRPETPND